MQFCKTLLGVKTSTQNNFIYGELGRINYQTHRYLIIIIYWLKVIQKNDNEYVNVIIIIIMIIIIIIISIFKEDNVFSITASLQYRPPVNTDIDYYRTFFGLVNFCKCYDVSCAIFC